MRRKAVQIMIKTIQRRLDAILHWNISFVGGFLGGYAILSHAGVFGSAQTGNPVSYTHLTLPTIA